MEGVATRRSFFLLLLALLPLVASPAAATAPIPPFERTVYAAEGEIGFVRSTHYEKDDPIGEKCVRQLICVGPFFPWMEVDFGLTGFRFLHNDTNVTVGHDPSKHDEFGPYVAPTLIGDDIRVCWSGCYVPTPLYAHAHGNYTLILYAFGREPESVTLRPNVTYEQPHVVPDRFGCPFAQNGCPD